MFNKYLDWCRPGRWWFSLVVLVCRVAWWRARACSRPSGRLARWLGRGTRSENRVASCRPLWTHHSHGTWSPMTRNYGPLFSKELKKLTYCEKTLNFEKISKVPRSIFELQCRPIIVDLTMMHFTTKICKIGFFNYYESSSLELSFFKICTFNSNLILHEISVIFITDSE